MDFTLDEHQEAVADLSAGLLAKEVDLGRPAGEGGYDEQAWHALAKAGLLALALPTELGGDGLGIGEVSVLLTEIGKTAAPVPALATLATGVLPINRLGTAAQRARLLPRIASGTELVTAAMNEPSSPLPSQPRTEATNHDGQWRLSGVKTGVAYASMATRILVSAAVPGGTGVFLLAPETAGVTLMPTRSAAGTPECTVRMDDAAVVGGDVLPGPAAENPARVLHRYAVAGAASMAAGVLAGALDLTTKHVAEREQFGKPLAAFQAVAQQVADVYIASRTVNLAATSAAWRLAAGFEPDSDLDIASYWLAEQAPIALQTCHHLHGGIGVDTTYPLHHYSSLTTDLVRFIGGTARGLERLSDLVKR